MLWSGANDTSDDSLESTEGGYAGLYRWTMDALFGSRVSPSRKYKEFAQDDTNYKREGKRRVTSPENTIVRSNSWSGLDSGFYRRNDLLPPSIGEDIEVPRPIESSNSLLNSSRVYLRPEEQPTDTFAARRRRLGDESEDHSIVLQSPQQDDPLISKLFQKKTRTRKPEEVTKRVQIPGKFPSPSKNAQQKNYTADYLEVLDQLSRNERLLDDLNQDFHKKQSRIQEREQTYQEKYLQTRAELIDELKHSKRLYDNYYKLYTKYQQLREISQDAVRMQHRISGLESQLVDSAIDKDRQIHDLTRKLFDMDLRVQESETARKREAANYQARIDELERQNMLQPDVGVSSLSFPPSNYRDTSSDYNPAIDSHFLKNLV